MSVNETLKAFIVLRFAEEFEGNAAWAYRTHHRRHFERRVLIGNRHLQIEDVIDVNLRLTLDDAAPPSRGPAPSLRP